MTCLDLFFVVRRTSFLSNGQPLNVEVGAPASYLRLRLRSLIGGEMFERDGSMSIQVERLSAMSLFEGRVRRV